MPYSRPDAHVAVTPGAPLALEEKYRGALELYVSAPGLSRAEVCRRCGVEDRAFAYYLRRYCPQYLRRGVVSSGPNLYSAAQRQATREKYREAVQLYESTGLSAKEICERTGVSVAGFRRHIGLYRRDLLLCRYSVPSDKPAGEVRLRKKGTGQTLPGHRKYKAAIEACDDVRYIEYNVSQIAETFGLDPSALGTQLRYHHPEIVSLREKERMRRGINDHLHRGARPWCTRQYAEAVEMLRTTDKTIRQAADECNVSFSGLRAHVAQYHKDVVSLRSIRRDAARNSRKAGSLNGCGVANAPRTDKAEQYRPAVELYRSSLLPLKEIARRTGVSLSGLTYHLYRWHRNLVLERKGIRPDGSNEFMDLSVTGHCLPSTARKYAAAIRQLRTGEMSSVAEVASSFGLHPDSFREYLVKHEPELAVKYGRRTSSNGRTVLSRTADKYAEAVHLYRTTPEPLKSIARRLGLVYNSLGGFVRRSCPDAIEQHNALTP